SQRHHPHSPINLPRLSVKKMTRIVDSKVRFIWPRAKNALQYPASHFDATNFVDERRKGSLPRNATSQKIRIYSQQSNSVPCNKNRRYHFFNAICLVDFHFSETLNESQRKPP